MRLENEEGGYSYIPGLPFGSAGVIALTGYCCVRAAFAATVPMASAFDAVREHLQSVARPLSALCGFELRMPAALSLADFASFNAQYLTHLRSLNLVSQGAPCLARTNVAPIDNPLSKPGVLAFSYTVPASTGARSFIVSGVPETMPGLPLPVNILRRGERDAAALSAKTQRCVDNVLTVIRQLGAGWDDACAVHLYSRWPLAEDLRQAMRRMQLIPTHGIIWHVADPPILELELEIDVRRYERELMLPTP